MSAAYFRVSDFSSAWRVSIESSAPGSDGSPLEIITQFRRDVGRDGNCFVDPRSEVREDLIGTGLQASTDGAKQVQGPSRTAVRVTHQGKMCDFGRFTQHIEIRQPADVGDKGVVLPRGRTHGFDFLERMLEAIRFLSEFPAVFRPLGQLIARRHPALPLCAVLRKQLPHGFDGELVERSALLFGALKPQVGHSAREPSEQTS